MLPSEGASHPRAARLWGAVGCLRGTSGITPYPPRNEPNTSARSPARLALGDDATFGGEWQEGRSMCLQQAVDIAIETEATP